MGIPAGPVRWQASDAESSSGNHTRRGVGQLNGVLLQLSTYSASQETSLYSRLHHEFPKTCVRRLFLRTLNTRSSFILLQLLDLFTTLAAFRAGGFELNPLVASLTVHFGRVGGIVLSKVIPVHREADSSMPPTIAPNRFEPSASPRKPAAAKLRMKIIPAKNTGRHSTSVAATTFTKSEVKKNLCRGME